jgi:hypothetical protein
MLDELKQKLGAENGTPLQPGLKGRSLKEFD